MFSFLYILFVSLVNVERIKHRHASGHRFTDLNLEGIGSKESQWIPPKNLSHLAYRNQLTESARTFKVTSTTTTKKKGLERISKNPNLVATRTIPAEGAAAEAVAEGVVNDQGRLPRRHISLWHRRWPLAAAASSPDSFSADSGFRLPLLLFRSPSSAPSILVNNHLTIIERRRETQSISCLVCEPSQT